MATYLRTVTTTPPTAEQYIYAGDQLIDPIYGDLVISNGKLCYSIERANTERFRIANLDGSNDSIEAFIQTATVTPAAHSRLATYGDIVYILRSAAVGAYYQIFLYMFNMDTYTMTSEQLTADFNLPYAMDIQVDSSGVYVTYGVAQDELYIGKCDLDGTNFVPQYITDADISQNKISSAVDGTYVYIGYRDDATNDPYVAKVLKSNIASFTTSAIPTSHSSGAVRGTYLVGSELFFIVTPFTNYEDVSLVKTTIGNSLISEETLYTATSSWDSFDGDVYNGIFYYCLRDISGTKCIRGEYDGTNTTTIMDIDQAITFTTATPVGPMRIAKADDFQGVLYIARDNDDSNNHSYFWIDSQAGTTVSSWRRI